MKIKELTIKDFKGLKSVKITPSGNTIIIAGKKGAGKSSALDAIVMALKGKDRKKPLAKPIRTGQKKAEIIIKTEQYMVTRTFTEKGDTLKLETVDKKQKFNKPKELLGNLLSDIGLAPEDFANADPKRQTDLMLEAVDLKLDKDKFNALVDHDEPIDLDLEQPLDSINEAIKSYADIRTSIGRDVTKLKGAFDAIDVEDGMEDAEPVSMTELVAKRDSLQISHNVNKNTREAYEAIVESLPGLNEIVQQAQKALETAKNILKKREENEEKVRSQVAKIEEVDFEEIDDKIANADKHNATAQQAKYKRDKGLELEEAEKGYETYTERIEGLRELKTDLLAKADFPVKGMSINDDGLLEIDGVPFAQRSTAENIEASLDIVAALDPKLKVMIFRNGNNLDAATFKAAQAWAEEHGYQLWIERVAEEPEEGVVFLKEGAVAK